MALSSGPGGNGAAITSKGLSSPKGIARFVIEWDCPPFPWPGVLATQPDDRIVSCQVDPGLFQFIAPATGVYREQYEICQQVTVFFAVWR
jgi:hypothetical protein